MPFYFTQYKNYFQFMFVANIHNKNKTTTLILDGAKKKSKTIHLIIDMQTYT